MSIITSLAWLDHSAIFNASWSFLFSSLRRTNSWSGVSTGFTFFCGIRLESWFTSFEILEAEEDDEDEDEEDDEEDEEEDEEDTESDETVEESADEEKTEE